MPQGVANFWVGERARTANHQVHNLELCQLSYAHHCEYPLACLLVRLPPSLCQNTSPNPYAAKNMSAPASTRKCISKFSCMSAPV